VPNFRPILYCADIGMAPSGRVQPAKR